MTTNFISYADAVKRFGNSYVLCNRVTEIDGALFERAMFDPFNEYGDLVDIYQYYITDCSFDDCDYLYKWYGIKFAYSEVLDAYILCVDHLGTSWDSVMIEDKSPRN